MVIFSAHGVRWMAVKNKNTTKVERLLMPLVEVVHSTPARWAKQYGLEEGNSTAPYFFTSV
jgi:hypothetical protein